MSDFTDSHGAISLLDESDWKNIVFSSSEKSIEIAGTNLNSLLKGLFFLFSKENISLPGGSICWEDIVPATFSCLNQLSSVEEIMTRVVQLLSHLRASPSGELFALVNGAIWFLWYWVHQYHEFIYEKEKIILHSYLKLIQKSLLIQPLTDPNFLITVQNLISCSFFSTTMRIQHYCEPNIYLSAGNWDGSEVLTAKDRSEALKAELSKMPKLKLEIFGADNLFDDDDDDEESENQIDQKNTEESITEAVVVNPFPVSRVKKDIPLLNVESLNILDLDTTEIARQWTLVDHEIFQLLPMHDVLQGCFSSQQPGEKTFENVVLSAIKKMVDQFNAASLWVTNAILCTQSPQDRAAVISKFIHISKEFHKLGNFHGLMVILTALQQGCIARLAISYDLIPKSDISTLNSLKVRFLRSCSF